MKLNDIKKNKKSNPPGEMKRIATQVPGRTQQGSHMAAGGSTTAGSGTSNSLQINSSSGTSKQGASKALGGSSSLLAAANSTSASNSAAGTSASKNNTTNHNSNSDSDLLEVTVIPVDEQPYSKHVQIPSLGKKGQWPSGSGASGSGQASSQSSYGQSARGSIGASSSIASLTNQYPSLKDLFQNSDSLWRPIFGSFVGANKKPQFAIFRKPIERRQDIAGIKRDTELSLHILYLKRDITQFPRNAFANQIEVYCSKFFYGPLVVVFCDTKPPYKLHDFPPYYLIDEIEPLNELEQKCYPLPFGAKRCSLVRALMSEERFTHNLENLERVLTNHEFMLYCYKTSFCPISNSTIHDWSKCNYAHRQQDFRRPPYLFFYYPERCPHISEDGSWEACEYELHCDYAHTLVEILFNPLHYKLQDCSEKTSADKFKCVKHKERCCHAHSNEEKKLCNQVLEQLVPKVLPQKEDIMQYYLEMLPDYQTTPSSANSPGGRADQDDSDSSPGGSNAEAATTTTNNAASGQQQDGKYRSSGGNATNSHENDNNDDSQQQASGGNKGGAGGAAPSSSTSASKKPKDASKAAANLQKASDLQRQKFMDVFQQMQASPAPAIQKTYKVKSESKPVVNNGAQSALLRPENPFSKVKAVVVNPIADSPKNSEKGGGLNEMTSDFHPFGDALSNSAAAGSPAKPTIFDKLDNKIMKNEMAQKMEKIEAAKVATIKDATAKVDKRLRKKGGKLVKGVVTMITPTQTTTTNNNNNSEEAASAAAVVRTPERASGAKRDSSPLAKTVSESMPQIPSLLKAQSTQITTTGVHGGGRPFLEEKINHPGTTVHQQEAATSNTPSSLNAAGSSSLRKQPPIINNSASNEIARHQQQAANANNIANSERTDEQRRMGAGQQDLKQSSGSRIATWTKAAASKDAEQQSQSSSTASLAPPSHQQRLQQQQPTIFQQSTGAHGGSDLLSLKSIESRAAAIAKTFTIGGETNNHLTQTSQQLHHHSSSSNSHAHQTSGVSSGPNQGVGAPASTMTIPNNKASSASTSAAANFESAATSSSNNKAAYTNKRRKQTTATSSKQQQSVSAGALKKASSATLPVQAQQVRRTAAAGGAGLGGSSAAAASMGGGYTAAASELEEEFADQELPQSDKESTEADIKMVKLQLLKHQMDSLKMSQEDSDHFYLQQISEARESHGDDSCQQQSLVPLLSSRSNSPEEEDDEDDENDDDDDEVEEQIIDAKQQRGSRSNNQQQQHVRGAPAEANQSTTTTIYNNNGGKNNHDNKAQQQQQHIGSFSVATDSSGRFGGGSSSRNHHQQEEESKSPSRLKMGAAARGTAAATKGKKAGGGRNSAVAAPAMGDEEWPTLTSSHEKEEEGGGGWCAPRPSQPPSRQHQQQQQQQKQSKEQEGEQQQQQQTTTKTQQKQLPPQLRENSGPPELIIYRKLACEYSAIEMADFFESVSMRLIALGLAELGYYRMRRRARDAAALRQQQRRNSRQNNLVENSSNREQREDHRRGESIPGELRQNRSSQHRALNGDNRDKFGDVEGWQTDDEEEESDEQDHHVVSLASSNQGTAYSLQQHSSSNFSSLQPQQSTRLQPNPAARQDMAPLQSTTGARLTTAALLMTPSSYLPLIPEDPQHLQVTHNRLQGSGRRGQVGWLNAFNWSLFVDPLTVWNACEVRELAATARRRPNCQWLISYNRNTSSSSSSGTVTTTSTTARPISSQLPDFNCDRVNHHYYRNSGIVQLHAMETVPPIVRHIWGLPLATSVGFGEPNTTNGLTPQAFAPSPNTTVANNLNNNSQTKQGAFRATTTTTTTTQQQQHHQPQQQQQQPPQIYKKGNNKTSRNSNHQASFQSSTTTLNEQNKA